jgi:HEAT repeat protein
MLFPVDKLAPIKNVNNLEDNMKKSVFILLPLLLIIFSVTASAFQAPKIKKAAINENSIASLLMGIHSENFGLKTSSAFMLGEIRASRGIIPLMSMLHSDKEEARIMAAVSLSKINSPKGMFAIKRAARFDPSERVRKICLSLYINSLDKIAH